ncbi:MULTISPECIES: sugar ABC transporter substrate-binding protein [unclassified Frondihabitans]|uniref:ABC transporter substrate-binding protein n=1 Tax=unclassified Frondihabitans TaxID=2626248 RepID=UPI000F4E688E|nr:MULTISPECIES: sugar ABC transporter substrate-binding protein [unclassified Frondihabitans]RPE78477.1 carbohydrate ABC transporter substrate-binding protein (CUT1 family) [Frondihabitans sp. PhB153]RPF08758.1 carbohydrate ABC transporter substrate-binding protein (CUT1 family) [Frondihabitans sp. PhB161]
MPISSRPGSARRRLTLVVAAAVGVALLATGCSASSSNTGSSSTYEAPSKDTKAELTYGVWDQTQVKAIKANLAGFNKEYPNIKVNVNVTPYDSYFTKLQTEASSNTLPDLFWLNGPNFQLYASNGKVEPITGEVKSGDITLSNYSSALDDLYSLDGVQYGVPKDFDTIGVWVNKALFEQAGVDLPKADWTWSDFQTAAATISSKLKGKGIYGVAGGMDGQTTYYNTIAQSGGDVINADGTKSGYDSAATKKGLEFWTQLIESGSSPTIQQLTDTSADQWFTSGKVAMFWGGSWARTEVGDSSIAKDVQVYPLPKGEKQATVIHGVSNVVAAGSKNKAAAQALQVYLASKEAQKQQGDMGAVIPAYTGTQTAFAKSQPGVDLQVFLDAVDYAVPFPVSKNTAAWNALEGSELPAAFSGSKPVATVADDLASQMNALLAKEK